MGLAAVRIILGRSRFCFLRMKDQTSSHSTSRTLTETIFSAMIRSHFLTSQYQEFQNRAMLNASDALHARYAVALQ